MNMLVKKPIVASIENIYCTIVVCHDGIFLRRKSDIKRYSQQAITTTCNTNCTNGTIPKKPSNTRVIVASIYARIFRMVIR